MRIEIQLRYTTGFDTIETTSNERAAIETAKAYRKRGYRVRIVHNGETCQVNPRALCLFKVRRYVENGRKIKHSFAVKPVRHDAFDY
jgi:hypothetical protein